MKRLVLVIGILAFAGCAQTQWDMCNNLGVYPDTLSGSYNHSSADYDLHHRDLFSSKKYHGFRADTDGEVDVNGGEIELTFAFGRAACRSPRSLGERPE